MNKKEVAIAAFFYENLFLNNLLNLFANILILFDNFIFTAAKGLAMNIILETERLLFREFTENDTPFIIELLNTEGWIKNIGDRNVKTTEDAKQYLLNGPLKSYTENGFGLSCVTLKDGLAIGMAGLIKRDSLPYIDIGYAFLPTYAAKGYAYEIVSTVLHYAFNTLKQKKILAITLPENTTSVKLIKKLGMQFEKTFIDSTTNEELAMYGISNAGL